MGKPFRRRPRPDHYPFISLEQARGIAVKGGGAVQRRRSLPRGPVEARVIEAAADGRCLIRIRVFGPHGQHFPALFLLQKHRNAVGIDILRQRCPLIRRIRHALEGFADDFHVFIDRHIPLLIIALLEDEGVVTDIQERLTRGEPGAFFASVPPLFRNLNLAVSPQIGGLAAEFKTEAFKGKGGGRHITAGAGKDTGHFDFNAAAQQLHGADGTGAHFQRDFTACGP
ncbi:MAG: hypothetical protein BWX80_03010 [Candidatus Hydrogenedentes bacterium ADurb.Bin101]|nr:MAG: hypothetical protein BWX80_03010 [Candidatus Hydrogenedentes bacterium ADurb.Bin101]